MERRKDPINALLLFALFAAPLLAGCTGAEDEGVPYGSYEEARDAPGALLESSDNEVIRLKLLEPAETEGVPTGELRVLVLVFDEESDTPVTDADFGEDRPQCGPSHGFCAEMPEMGHGTSPEEAPEHVEHGVYRGMTTISMAGNWTMHFRPQIDGQVVEFDTQLRTG